MISFGFKRVSTPSAIQFWCHFEQFKMLLCFKTSPTWRNFQTETKWKIILNRGKFNVLSTPKLVKNLGKTLCLAIEIDLKAIWVSVRKLQIQMTTVACPDSMEMKCKACRLCFMLRTYSMWVCQCVCLCVCVCLHVCETQLAVGLEVAADCQSVKSPRTYCQQLLSSADNSIYIGVYVCVYKRVCMPGYTHRHIYIYRDRDRYKQRHANWGSARCLHWKFKFFCY